MFRLNIEKPKTGVFLLHVRLPKLSGNLLLDHNFSKFNPDQRLYIAEGAVTFFTKLKQEVQPPASL